MCVDCIHQLGKNFFANVKIYFKIKGVKLLNVKITQEHTISLI